MGSRCENPAFLKWRLQKAKQWRQLHERQSRLSLLIDLINDKGSAQRCFFYACLLCKTKQQTKKNPTGVRWGFSLLRITSLTITYFHTGCSTIIGAKLFHGPVRDGKGWDQLAMVIRHNLYWRLSPVGRQSLNLEEAKIG